MITRGHFMTLRSSVLAIIAGIGAAIVLPFSGVLAFPLIVAASNMGLQPSNSWIAIPPALAFLGIGLALGNEKYPRPWLWALLLSVGVIIGGIIAAYFMVDEVQGGIQMDAQWVHEEWRRFLRLATSWLVLPGIVGLLVGTWGGVLVAARRERQPRGA